MSLLPHVNPANVETPLFQIFINDEEYFFDVNYNAPREGMAKAFHTAMQQIANATVYQFSIDYHGLGREFIGMGEDGSGARLGDEQGHKNRKQFVEQPEGVEQPVNLASTLVTELERAFREILTAYEEAYQNTPLVDHAARAAEAKKVSGVFAPQRSGSADNTASKAFNAEEVITEYLGFKYSPRAINP
ncbi:MAG: hypothetical protein J0L97_11325 [Alphaproteobacteria bacterium]|nr:hypothetical protein [Alphaproteobacteria bacterium]